MSQFESPTTSFALSRFCDSMREFWGCEEAFAIVDDGWPDYSERGNLATAHALLVEKRKMVFFPFCGSFVDEPLKCVDGRTIDPDQHRHEDAILDQTTLAEDANYGFLVRLEDGIVYIDNALNVDGHPMTIVDDAGIFDAPMKAHLGGFAN